MSWLTLNRGQAVAAAVVAVEEGGAVVATRADEALPAPGKAQKQARTGEAVATIAAREAAGLEKMAAEIRNRIVFNCCFYHHYGNNDHFYNDDKNNDVIYNDYFLLLFRNLSRGASNSRYSFTTSPFSR